MSHIKRPAATTRVESDVYFETYWEYARLWRTWVVGIAAGALFVLLNKEIGATFQDRAKIGALFVVAAGLQVAIAAINKTASHYAYLDQLNKECKCKTGGWTRLWCWISNRYSIDILIDAASLVAVVWAVWIMVSDVLPYLSGKSVGTPVAQIATSYEELPTYRVLQGRVARIDLTRSIVEVNWYNPRAKTVVPIRGIAVPETRILLNDAAAPLTDLKSDDRVTLVGQLEADASGATHIVLARIDISRPSGPTRRTTLPG